MPSARLEQQAHRFGLRERVLAMRSSGSPQQMQIRMLITLEQVDSSRVSLWDQVKYDHDSKIRPHRARRLVLKEFKVKADEEA